MKQTFESYPRGIGAMLRGWDGGIGSVLDFRAMTHKCPRNCPQCFVKCKVNPDKKTLSLSEIQRIIDEAADLGYRGIDYLGVGETTFDEDFFPIVEHTSRKGLIPIVFSEAATKLRDKDFVKRLYDSGASVCPKCDSLFDEEYQNFMVGDASGDFFRQRNQALDVLMRQGFNQVQEDGSTRLGFDMVVSSRNINEVEKTLKYCRNNNLWVVFCRFLPAGRSGSEEFDRSLMIRDEQLREIQEVVRRVDAKYKFFHPIYSNFATMPCVELVQIYGDGRVSPCPGNETVVGDIRRESLGDVRKRVLELYPCHNPETFDGNCLYR